MKLLKKLEDSGLLFTVVIVLGFLGTVGHMRHQTFWVGLTMILFAIVAVLDVSFCLIRTMEEWAFDKQAAKELVSGVYRLAEGHHVIEDGNRVIVYQTGEEL